MALKEQIDRTLDLWAMCVYDILPKRVVYWVALRAIGKATMKSQNIPATSLDNILDNLGNVREGKPLVPFLWDDSKRNPEVHDVHIAVDPNQLLVDDIEDRLDDLARKTHG